MGSWSLQRVFFRHRSTLRIVNDRGRESECSPSLRTGQAVFQRPALQLMGSTVRLRASRFRDRLLALSALYAGCGQVEQPGLVKEAVSPSGVIVDSFGLPLSFGPLSQDASQSSSNPTIHRLEGIEFAVLEVVIPPPQNRIDSCNDALQTLAVGSAGSFA